MHARVLVVYASRHGATRGIAERIAATLAESGVDATLEGAQEVEDVSGFDAYVIGSAAYATHWLKEATDFVRHHRNLLAGRPVWLFSSGPVGPEVVDKKGRNVLEASVPTEIAEFGKAIHPRGHQVFFGAYDPNQKPIGIAERLGEGIFKLIPEAREALPSGDFRDWATIDAWAGKIARELTTVVPAA